MPKKPDFFNPVGQCCELDEPYQAPPGTFDQPFIYVYDADDLPDGQERRFANIKTFSGPDFLMRRVAGHDRACTDFQLRDVLGRLVCHEPVKTAGFGEFTLIPEMMFPSASGITFDLLPVAKTLNGCDQSLAQIVFQGVRRFKGYRRPPSYPYWEDDFSYTPDISLDYGPGTTRRYSIDIHDFDFELLRICETIINPSGGGGPVVPGGSHQAFKFQLYDQVYEQVFSAPIIDDLIMDNSSSYQGITPVPGIVYRIGQQIRFEITPLCEPSSCATLVSLRFHGVRRRPC
jgi:hypothetical protein